MKKLLVITLTIFYFSLFTLCNAQAWSAMDTGLYHASGQTGVYTLQEYNNTLYAGGYFAMGGNNVVSCIAQWNGTIWDSVKNNHNPAFASEIYNGNLIMGSYSSVSQWNGVKWSTFGADTSFFIKQSNWLHKEMYLSISALTVYNGNLVVGGNFDSIPGIYANNIAYWNGTNFNTFGSGFTGIGSMDTPSIAALVVYNGNLYAGGLFDSAGGIPAHNIAMWDGSSWQPVGSGVNGGISSLAVYNGNLYAGGRFDSVGGIPAHNIAMWNGVQWDSVGKNMNCNSIKVPRFYNLPTSVYTLTPYNGNLYAGGFFDSIGGIAANSIACWNGTVWQSLGKGLSLGDLGGYVYTITGSNNTIYIGGAFDTVGGIRALNVAMYSIPTGINEITNSSVFNVYPNPNNGVFTLVLSHPELVSGSQTIEIYNVLGEKVLTETLRSAQGDNNINISSQPNGIYLYRVITETGVLIDEGKIIVQR